MTEFFAMGGYAAYVWPAYGVSAAVMAALAYHIWRRGKHLRKRLAEYESRRNETPDGNEQ